MCNLSNDCQFFFLQQVKTILRELRQITKGNIFPRGK